MSDSQSSNLVSRLRQRLITVPKPDTRPFDMPAAGYFQMGSVGGTHKPGDSAGVLSVFTTCANGGNKLQEHIYAVDPLCEEAATEIERLRPMAESWESYESAQDRKGSAVETSARQPPKSIATVINNNQPGWTNIVETAPNVTLPVGTKLYDESALISVGCGVADEIWKRQSSVEPTVAHPLFTCKHGAIVGRGCSKCASEKPTQPPFGCCDGCKMPIGVCRCLEKAMKLAATPEKASETPQHDFRGPTVSCRCGWIGHPNALIGLTCPKCSAEFK